MNSQHSQFSSDNKTDLEALGLIKELDNETSQVISGGVTSDLVPNPTITPNPPVSNLLDIYNGTPSLLYFDLNFGSTIQQDIVLKPGNAIDFTDPASTADVRFDGDLSQAGIQLNKTTLKAPGNYAFSLAPTGILNLG